MFALMPVFLLLNTPASLETSPSIGCIRVNHRGILLAHNGTVYRSGVIKMFEGERMYRCWKCKYEYVLLTARWSPDIKDVRCNLEPVFIANHVRRTNELKLGINIPDEIILKFQQFWSDVKDSPLKGRNAILRGICPQVFGLFTVKLAVALTLIGGVQHVDASGTKIHGESHLLLVGDPGTGKSRFLKFAAKLSNRSVISTGLGSTSAGLTVQQLKMEETGHWKLELLFLQTGDFVA